MSFALPLRAAITAGASLSAVALVLAGGISSASAVDPVTVSSVTIAASVATVYPKVDGYLDLEPLEANVQLSGPIVGDTITGSIKVIRKGKTVASFPITSDGITDASWKGKVKGKVKPGTYTAKVTATLKGANTRTATTTFSVSKKKLTSVTKTVTYSAKQFFTSYDSAPYCSVHGGSLNCTGQGNFSSASAFGQVQIPAAVLAWADYTQPKANVTLTVTRQKNKTGDFAGGAGWYWGDNLSGASTPNTPISKTGKHKASGRLALTAGANDVDADFFVSNTATVTVSKISVKYYYVTLK